MMTPISTTCFLTTIMESQGIRIKTTDVAKSNNISQSVPTASCIGLKKIKTNSGRAGKHFKMFK